MSSKRRHALIAVVAGVVVAGGVTAIAATQFGGSSTHTATIPTSAAAPQASGSGNFSGKGQLGGNGNSSGSGVGGRPGFGGGGFRGGGGGLFGGLSAAATYLGVSQTTLESDLASGKTMAQVAKDQGKTVDGLVTAMVDSTRKQLDAQVGSGRFTKQQEATIVASLEQRYKALVNGTRPSGGFGGGGFRGGGFGGGRGPTGSINQLGGSTVPA
jgi:hypothetical protein